MSSEREIGPDDTQTLRRGRLMRQMVGTEAWQEYENILKAQLGTRLNIVLSPPSESLKRGMTVGDSHLNDLFLKGVIFGLNLALGTAHGMIMQAKDLADELNPADAAKEELLG